MSDRGAWSRPGFIAAVLAFLAQGAWLAWSAPCWHEEVSAQVEPAPRLVIERPDGSVAMEPSCADPDAPWLVRSAGRPMLSLCIRGLALPIMTMAYASGISAWPFALLWPLHHGNPFILRMLCLILGVWALFLVHRIAARMEDEPTGDLSALVLAASTQFTTNYSVLFQYEVFPMLWLGTAALLLLRAGDGGRAPEARRVVAAQVGLLIGLALISNLKTILLLAPVAVVIARASTQSRGLPRREWAAAPLCAALPLALLVWASATDPRHGVARQVSIRLHTLLSHLQPVRFARELGNVLVYWSDLRYYGDLIVGRRPQVNWPGAAVAALALGYGVWLLVRFLVARQGSWLAAVATGEIVLFIAVSVLLYEQQPAANYWPIHACFGWVTGIALRRAMRYVSSSVVTAGIVGALGVGAFGWASLARLAMPPRMPVPINAFAERAVANHLRTTVRAGNGLLVTTVYNHAGLLDALGLAAFRPASLHAFFNRCERDTEAAPAPAANPCLVDHWGRLLDRRQNLPLRAVIPARASIIDERWSPSLEPSLRAASAARGFGVVVEATFDAPSGPQVIRLLRVDPRSHG
jgi:hypothetical protein